MRLDFHAASTPSSARGAWAEDFALDYLLNRGLHCLERNFRAAGGEIDIVMRHGTTIAFIEVRLRANDRFGGAAHSVTLAKQRRLVRAAEAWLMKTPGAKRRPCRFDVLALTGKAPAPTVNWLRSAFEA